MRRLPMGSLGIWPANRARVEWSLYGRATRIADRVNRGLRSLQVYR